jgi:PAS domain S-box-containing protein
MKKPSMKANPGDQKPEDLVHRDDLRRRAEDALEEQPAGSGSMNGGEVQRLIHELQIHQVELEMQNETLRQTQAELEEARDRYFALFELAPVGYLLLSPKGKILEVNLAAAKLLEIERTRLKQTSLTDYIVREDQDIFYLAVQRARRENTTQEFELRMQTCTGTQIDVAVQCTLVEEQGQPAGPLRVTLSDISGRIQQARDLAAYAHRLEILNKDLEEFTYMVSHDMKEPLHKISRFGKLILSRSAQLDEEGRDFLKRMISASERMGVLIDALLALSRLTIQKTSYQQVDLNQVVRDAAAQLEVRVQETGAQVEIGPLPTITAEPTQMEQLFMNLIGNALKFHQPGLPPRVQITGSRTPAGEVEIHVVDNGIGFDPESALKLFKPFARLHGKSKYEGTGMGLAICRKIVENHAGQINTRSAPGQGAAFTVILPVQPLSIQGLHDSPGLDGADR